MNGLTMRPIRTVATMACATLLSGCVFGGGGQHITYEESIRLQVSFASVVASSVFHSALEEADRGDFTEGGGMFILFVFALGGANFHETQFYNAQVRIADANRNGVITEEEAENYAEWVEEHCDEKRSD